MTSKTLKSLALILLFTTLNIISAWGAEGDSHDVTSGNTREVLLNGGADIDPILITGLTYSVKEVQVTCNYNKSTDGVTVSCTVNGSAFGSAQTIKTKTTTTFKFSGTSTTGDVKISFVNNTTASSGMGTFKVTAVNLIEGAGGGSGSTKYTVV